MRVREGVPAGGRARRDSAVTAQAHGHLDSRRYRWRHRPSHVAVVRKAGMVRLFVEGQPSPSMPYSGNLSDLQPLMWVGTGGPGIGEHDLPGDLDGFRVSAGALYWDAFAPTDTCP